MFRQQQLHFRREPEQAQQIGNSCTILSSTPANLLMAEMQFSHEAVQRLSELDRIKVLALDIFDERQLEEAIIRVFLDDHGYLIQTSQLGSSEATLPCHQLNAH